MTESTDEPATRTQWHLYEVSTKQPHDEILYENESDTEKMNRNDLFWHSHVKSYRVLIDAIMKEMPAEGIRFLKLAEPPNNAATFAYGSKEQRQDVINEWGKDFEVCDRAPLELQPNTEMLSNKTVCIDHQPILGKIVLRFSETVKEVLERVLGQCSDTLQWEDRTDLTRQEVELVFV